MFDLSGEMNESEAYVENLLVDALKRHRQAPKEV